MNYPMIERAAPRPYYYGMRANDSTYDNAPAFQAALNAAAGSGANGTVAVVNVPQGNFYIKTPIYIPQKVILRGTGVFSSVIQADASFPATTPMVYLGLHDGAGPIFHCRLESVRLEGAGHAADGVYTNQAQELSGLKNVLITGYTRYGIHYAQGAIHCDFEDLWVFNNAAGVGAIGFFGDAFGGPFSIRNASFVSAAGSAVQAAAIKLVGVSAMNGGPVLLERVHVENATHGIQFGPAAFGTVINCDGLTDVVNLITINSGAGPVVCLSIAANGSTHTINDLQQVIVDDSQTQPFWISNYPGALVSKGMALGGRLLTPSLFVPTAAAGVNAGASPPDPVVTAHSQDQRGTITWGSGTAASPGVQVTVTFDVPAFRDGITVQLTPINSATATLQPYAANAGATSFQISTVGDPTDSQANTVYGVHYSVGANS